MTAPAGREACGNVDVRPLDRDFADWEGLLSLILRAFAPMEGVIDPPSSALRLTLRSLEAKARGEKVLLAWRGARLVGCLFAAGTDSILYLSKLAVEPAFQGLGIGGRLVAAAERLAQAEGKAALELQTRIELTGNQAAFARLGFREAARTAHPGFSRPTSITLRKALLP